jgi:hypothetical protein
MNTLQAVVIVSMAILQASPTPQAPRNGQYFLEQAGCPFELVSDKGSTVVLRNKSTERVVSYSLACFAKKGQSYESTFEFATEEASTEPGEFASQGGLDATPLNVCKSRAWLLGVFRATFTEGRAWISPLAAPNKTAERLP